MLINLTPTQGKVSQERSTTGRLQEILVTSALPMQAFLGTASGVHFLSNS